MPDHSLNRRFDEVAQLVRDAVPLNALDPEVPYLGLEHLLSDGGGIARVGRGGDITSPPLRFRAGDVLFGKLRPYFRKVARPTFDGVCSPEFWVLRPLPGIDANFLYQTVRHPAFSDYALSGSEGTRMPRASWTHVSQYLVRIPSIAEQRSIAEVLGALDDKIDANARLLPVLRDLAKASLQQAALGGKTYQVGDVADVRKGLSYTGAGLAEPGAGMPMVNLANAENFGWLKRSGFKHYTGPYKPRHVAKPGALMVSGVDLPWKLRIIGWPMLLPDDVGEALFSHHVFLIDFPAEHAWLRLPLWAHLYTAEARGRLEGMIYGTTVARFPPEAVIGLEFPAPEKDDAVLEAAGNLIRRAWAAERENDALARLRDALLPPLLSGELRVGEAESLVGEAV